MAKIIGRAWAKGTVSIEFAKTVSSSIRARAVHPMSIKQIISTNFESRLEGPSTTCPGSSMRSRLEGLPLVNTRSAEQVRAGPKLGAPENPTFEPSGWCNCWCRETRNNRLAHRMRIIFHVCAGLSPPLKRSYGGGRLHPDP